MCRCSIGKHCIIFYSGQIWCLKSVLTQLQGAPKISGMQRVRRHVTILSCNPELNKFNFCWYILKYLASNSLIHFSVNLVFLQTHNCYSNRMLRCREPVLSFSFPLFDQWRETDLKTSLRQSVRSFCVDHHTDTPSRLKTEIHYTVYNRLKYCLFI